MDLDGRAAIVTGGGTGVGRATALELSRRGCSVLINYSRSKAEAEAVADEVRQAGGRAIAVQADVAEDADCQRLVASASKEFGRLDVLVNNAGTTVFVPHHELDRVKSEDWDRIFAVNVKGPYQCSRAARAAIEASGGGEIVNVSSVAGTAGTGSSIPYCASKAALDILTVTLARVLGPAIRVNGIAPGFITGRWLRDGWGDQIYEAVKTQIEGRVPLRAVCEPEDVSAAILAMIEGSDLVTGQTLMVDGGMTIAG